MTKTTITVSLETSDRLKAQAAQVGVALDQYLCQLADRADRDARFAAMRTAYVATRPEDLESYRRETRDWLDADMGG